MTEPVITVGTSAEQDEQDFESPRGDTFDLNLTFLDSAGDAVNLTGYTFKLTAKPSKSLADNGTGVVQVSGSIVSAANGTALIRITKEATAAMLGVYFYDAQYVVGSVIKTFMRGRIVISEDVTLATS